MKRTTNSGFTLIELMVVVAVLGIIVAIGYPAYTDQVRKSRRAEGMGELLELADRMERHYSDQSTYDQIVLGVPTDMTAGALWKSTTTYGYYTLSIDAGTTNVAFTARAAPTTKGRQNLDKCGTFIVNSQGTKSLTGAASGYTNEDCWR